MTSPNRTISSETDDTPNAYGGVFWLTYLANSALMVAVGLLFRYSDFVFVSGGDAFELSWIIGIGTVGALSMRVFQGVGIDRFGPRRVWLLSLSLFVISVLAHLLITNVHGPAVYLARITMLTGLAGAFGASITFVSLRVPERRMAEMIGTLGSSGFVGIALGPMLGDFIVGSGEVTRLDVQRLFTAAAISGCISLIATAFATRGHLRRKLRKQPLPHLLIKRYHPGVMLLVAAAMGIGISFPMVYVRPYTQQLGIDGIKTFFLVYAGVAFAMRISTRRLPERIGVRPMILMGFGSLALSMLLYLFVRVEWQLAIPAVFAGIAHAFLFPSVVSGGSLTFPIRYRGLATTLMLALFDVGNFVGQPVLGFIHRVSKQFGLPAYPAMFVSVAVLLVTVGGVYAVISLRKEKLQSKPNRIPANDDGNDVVSLPGKLPLASPEPVTVD
jgi:MFS family permease